MNKPPPLPTRKGKSRVLPIFLILIIAIPLVWWQASSASDAWDNLAETVRLTQGKPANATPNGSEDSESVTFAEYNLLGDGISYADACRFIGYPGTELSRSSLGGIETVMYSWSNRNGSNMNAIFQNGKLTQKAQFGLK